MRYALALLGLIVTSINAAELDPASAGRFAALVLKGIDREYPNKPGEVLTTAEDIMSPRAMHPAFYGCFDWHSSVHGHWLLVRLLRLFPQMPGGEVVRAKLNANLSRDALAVEAAYFDKRENRGFERMYGWAWALRLVSELRMWDDPDARRMLDAIAPLEKKIVALTRDYLPRLTYPIRTGVHPDTAFALSQMLDYSRIVGDVEFEKLIASRARDYYVEDRDYPTRIEPSGEDFFSPGLNVADLLRRILSKDEFSRWLERYLPSIKDADLGRWMKPAEVSDLSDPRIVHLVGLNLSRAWTLQGIASALDPGDARRGVLEKVTAAHADAGLKHIFTGHYEGEHWLATFAVYHLTRCGVSGDKAPPK